MSPSPWSRLLGALLLVTLTATAHAQTGELTIRGQVGHVLHLTLADLRSGSPAELDLSFATGHGEEKAHYAGVTLWSLIQRAGLPDEPGKGEHHLARTLAVTGRDGYTVSLAIGEIDPEFEDKQVLIAFARDGQPIKGTGLRLVVPGDRKGGRSVRDVVDIEVK